MITGLLNSAVFFVSFWSFTWEVLLKFVKHMLRCYSFLRGFLLEHTLLCSTFFLETTDIQKRLLRCTAIQISRLNLKS